jgi:hypothetical protein
LPAAFGGLVALALSAGALGDGACCFIEGTCVETPDANACEALDTLGGTYLGDGTTCDTADCTGASCLLDGTCTDGVTFTEALHIDQPLDPDPPGFFEGIGTSCPQPQCLGACCLSDGTCVEDRTETQCISDGGVFLGTGTSCPGGTCYAVVQGDIFGPQAWYKELKNDERIYTFDKFDESLGDLIRVRVESRRTYHAQYFSENLDPLAGTINATVGGTSTLEVPNDGGSIFFDTCNVASPLREQAVGPADQDPGEGDDFAFFGDFVEECTPVSFETTDPGDLAFFTGSGQQYDVRTFTNVNFNFGGTVDSQNTVIFQGYTGQIRITYFYAPPCTGVIGDFVWEDLNANGCQDPGEPGVPNVRVRLFEGGDLVATDFTDASGLYLFEDLCAGDYELQFDQIPPGFTETIPNAGCDAPSDENDSDCINGIISPVILEFDDSEDLTNDCGLIPDCEGQIGDFVWHDLDEDGCQDPDEPGIPDVRVRLFRDGNLLATDFTDASGFYLFEDLCAGEYDIVFDQTPPGFTETVPNAGCDAPSDENDSDCINGIISPVILDAIDTVDLTNDCGLIEGEPGDKCGCDEKGSLLIFSKVEVRWDSTGENLVQDTFIEILNDYPEDVQVQMYFVNGDPPIPAEGDERAHPGWNWVDNLITLTGNEPTYWSAATGLPKGVSPWSVLDPGPPPGRPANDGTGERVLRGFIVAWAVNADGEEIRWNHLAGEATLVNYPRATAWSYKTCGYQTVDENVAHGEDLPNPGVLNLDNLEYGQPPALLLMNFQAVGSAAWSNSRQVVTNTDLTLHPVEADLRQESNGPVATKAHFNVWNENEVKFSGAYRCITCWDQTLLEDYGVPNHFLLNTLQTDHGKARIDGLASQLCDDSVAAAILGVKATWLNFDAGAEYDAAGGKLFGMGCESAVIRYDVVSVPPESPDQPNGGDLPFGVRQGQMDKVSGGSSSASPLNR